MKNFSLCLGMFLALTLKVLAITWGSPTIISGNNADSSKILMDGSGHAFSVWNEFDGTNVVTKAAVFSTTWGATQTISSTGFNATNAEVSASNNSAAALARIFDGSNFVIEAAVYSSGSWGSPVTISTAATDAFDAKVSMNSAGDAIAIWGEGTATLDVIKVAHYTASTQTWGSPVTISDTLVQSELPDIAYSDSGKAIATWSFDNGTDSLVAGASFVSGSWSSPQTLSTAGANSTSSRVAINASGVGIAIWERSNDPLNFDRAQVSRFNGTSWSLPVTVSQNNKDASSPDIAINNLGNAMAVWQNSNANFSVSVGANYFSTNWKGAKVVATEVINSKIHVGIDGTNKTYAIWSADRSGHSVVRVANFNGSWHAPQNLSNTSEDATNPEISVDPSGDAFVSWDNTDGTNFVIEAVHGVP